MVEKDNVKRYPTSHSPKTSYNSLNLLQLPLKRPKHVIFSKMEDKLKVLFSDLGRRTLRGVKPCPKCGTFNGTRGFACKNQNCNQVFKQPVKDPSSTAASNKSNESCRLHWPDPTQQVYSVRLRSQGPDYRAFVQLTGLPVDMMEGTSDVCDSPANPQAHCFVSMCSQQRQENPDVPLTTCQHIDAALKCQSESEVLIVKDPVLSSINAPDEVKQSIWQLCTEMPGALVQRVSKTVLVVRCKPTVKHPLGLLHAAIYPNRNPGEEEWKFVCSCKALKGSKCEHYYSCLCAFASDVKLTEEFASFISLGLNSLSTTGLVNPLSASQLVTFMKDTGEGACEMQIGVLPEDALMDSEGDSTIGQIRVLDTFSLSEGVALPEGVADLSHSVLEPVATLDANVLAGVLNFSELDVPRPNLEIDENGENHETALVRAKPIRSNLKRFKPSLAKKTDLEQELSLSQSFLQWLSMVTERINLTMHYQGDGKPDPLEFLVPQNFFDYLKERISKPAKKRRLPNHTLVVKRKDTPPFGTYFKYIWELTNLAHVKAILDNPWVPLEVTRSFVENRDGSFDLFIPKPVDSTVCGRNQTPIRPSDLRTFMRVGPCPNSNERLEPVPFIIEWTPDLLPASSTGEMRIIFQYGHQRNGILDACKMNLTNSSM